MAQTGIFNSLQIVKMVPFGIYLDAGDLGEVLLPSKFAPADVSVGDVIDVFLYTDSEDMVIATTQKPFACAGEFAYLKVVANTQPGAFLDWGLEKDLLVPFNQQRVPMEVNRNYVVYVYRDEKTQRLAASTKLDRFLDKKVPKFKKNEAVSVLIAQRTDLGYKAIINSTFWGVIYTNEIFKPIRVGQTHTAYIKQVRSDGRIDLSLQPPTHEIVDELSQAILEHLKRNGGNSTLSDKSDPAVISQHFGVSKNAFKRAIGGLFKAGRIALSKEGMKLLD
ncbi:MULTISPECIES: S1-like domain-containing RNA-binding protein [Motilimonas]|uniref:GntR family transcriptional regulator n=1 Tax=Motilimonas cestriensis TaxID=2742685 RepID=A0ABS8WIR9_9GAMM|nr:MULTISPECIES: S1-like domain-containing RNA-binding protein [Motilimonas]MCE0555344.1 GntR family transcriptional regulator [Motilimonas sp. E26]MCE2597245.1 GntR family transcriptional regulator [Motilimonas cestriensis]